MVFLFGAPAAADPQAGALPQEKLSQAEAEAALRSAGVTWSSSGHCADRDNPACTSFEAINEDTVSGITSLRRTSGCPINVTGGTESGHREAQLSHRTGYKADISHNGCVDAYLERTLTRIGDRADHHPQWQTFFGDTYCDEGDHWDIVYP